MTDVPLACSLDSKELYARSRELLPGLVTRAIGRADIPNGFCWTFTATDGLLAEIGHLIDTERKCCPFMRFVIVVEASGGQVSLDVTGPSGTREFLQRLTNPKTGVEP